MDRTAQLIHFLEWLGVQEERDTSKPRYSEAANRDIETELVIH